jgi:hypothetical protein
MSALHRRRLLASIGSALTVGLAGCGSDSPGSETGAEPATDPGTGRTTGTATPAETVTQTTTRADAPAGTATTTGTASGTARIRVAHMSPDAPDLVASVDGAIVPEDLGVPFGRVGDYAEVPAGAREVSLTELNDDDVFFEREVALAAADHTFVAAGEVVDDDPEFRVLPLVDDNTDPGAETARLRVLHVSPDAGPVDVTVDAGPALFEDLGFAEGGYVPVEAGEYTLRVRSGSGTGDGEVIEDQVVTLDGGAVYTAFVSGYRDVEFASEASFDLAVVRDATA